MSDKPKPVDDLKEGLGLLFRAAKGAVETAKGALPTDKIETVAKDAVKEVGRAFESLPTDKIETAAKDAVKEVGRAFESLGNEIEKVVDKVSGSTPPAQHAAPPQPPPAAQDPQPPPQEVQYDDGYAPEPPPKGPRIG